LSLVEVVAVVFGYAVAVVTQLLVFPGVRPVRHATPEPPSG
jgi:hypothetical protein